MMNELLIMDGLKNNDSVEHMWKGFDNWSIHVFTR